MRNWRKFRHDESGAAALMVALSLLVLLMVAGAVIDFGRAFYVRTVLQGSIDSASLAAALQPIDSSNTPEAIAQTEQTLKPVAQAAFSANFTLPTSLARTEPVTLTYQPKTAETPGKLIASVSAVVPTTFMKIFAVNEIDLDISSTSQLPQPGPIDLALVLDTTLSMASPPALGGEAKLTTLKTAATDLVNKVTESGSSNIQIGIVPYAEYIKVGQLDPVPDWIFPLERTTTSCTKTEWVVTPDCSRMKTTYYDCLRDGVMVTNGCSRQECSTTGSSQCTQYTTTTFKWTGCVGARSVLTNNPANQSTNQYTDQFLDKISSPTYPKYAGPAATGCGTQILPLTNDKQTVLSRISALTASGNTHIPSGLIWGWNILAPGEPYDARTADQLKKLGGRKALVLMTDGINSSSPRLWDGSYQLNGSNSLVGGWKDGTKTNALTSTLCENIKSDGIEVYTVLFDVAPGSSIESILRNCATDSATMAFVASDKAGLQEAFKKIGDRLRKLQLLD